MEQKSSLTQQTPGSSTVSQFVMLGKDLLSLIGTFKNMQAITTYAEVLDGLKTYIWEKQLIDPQNPYRVHCKDDMLGSVLGMKDFAVKDVNLLLHKWVTPVNKLSNNSLEVTRQAASALQAKRKLEDPLIPTDSKKTCSDESERPISPMFLYIPPSPAKNDYMSDDSAHTIQEIETAYASDTSDTILDSSDKEYFEDIVELVDETFAVEYEVESDSSSDCSIAADSSSDSEEDFVAAEVAMDAALLSFVSKGDSDIEFFADDSSGEDIEIPKSDHWKCKQCDFSNSPTMRCCARCWREREVWFTEKADHPKRKKKGERKKASVRNELRSMQDSQGSTTSSQTEPTLSQESTSSSGVRNSTLCILCCAKPADATIVHGNYGHQFTCYQCARTLKKRKKRCPYCRKMIEKVIHQVTAFDEIAPNVVDSYKIEKVA